MSADIAATLREAAQVLERDGWCQGTFHSHTGEHCAIGALATVTGLRVNEIVPQDDPRFHRHRAAVGALCAQIGSRNIMGWNDATGRRREDVVKALLQAADTVEVES